MDANFFDLPGDVRNLVWKRARYLSARDRVAGVLEGRSRCVMLAVGHSDTAGVILQLSPTKTLMIKQHLAGDGPETVVVEVVDTSEVKIFWYVFNRKVRISLGTARSTRNVAFRRRDDGSSSSGSCIAARNDEFVSWYTRWDPPSTMTMTTTRKSDQTGDAPMRGGRDDGAKDGFN